FAASAGAGADRAREVLAALVSAQDAWRRGRPPPRPPLIESSRCHSTPPGVDLTRARPAHRHRLPPPRRGEHHPRGRLPNAQSLAILAVGMGDLAQAAAGRQREPPPHLRQCRLTLGSLRPLHQRTERLADFPERLSVAVEDLLPDLPDRLVLLL